MQLKGLHKFFLFSLVFVLLLIVGYFLSLKLYFRNQPRDDKSGKNVFEDTTKPVSDYAEFFTNFKSLSSAVASPYDTCAHKDNIVEVLGYNSTNSTLRLGINNEVLVISKSLVTNMPSIENTIKLKDLYYFYSTKCADSSYINYILPFRSATFVRFESNLVFIKDEDGTEKAIIYSDELPVHEYVTKGDVSTYMKTDANALKELNAGDKFKYALLLNSGAMTYDYKNAKGEKSKVDAYQVTYIFGTIVL